MSVVIDRDVSVSDKDINTGQQGLKCERFGQEIQNV